MNPYPRKRRLPRLRGKARGLAAALAAMVTVGGLAAVAGPAYASPAGGTVTNPYSPAYGHAYRHGVIPTLAREATMKQWVSTHPAAALASANDLNYGGGIDGIGVTTGPEKVYLVFYGSQWGTQSTNGNGDVTLSGDPSGEVEGRRFQDDELGSDMQRGVG